MKEIKNLKKAAKRIQKAIKKDEKIILFGDGDLDGATSLLILEESINSLGKQVAVKYFPDREKEGYGLNKIALEKLSYLTPCLLINLDSGIASFKELTLAKKMGFEVIVIDHHEVLDRVPKDALIIDPKQDGDKHEFKKLSTSSIAYRLSKILVENMSNELDKSFMELSALGVIADMMPEESTNKYVIDHGVVSIFSSFRIGFKVLQDLLQEDCQRSFFSKMVGILNITEIKDNLTQTYVLLSSTDYKKAKELARQLILSAQRRKEETKETANSIVSDSNIVFEGDPNWKQSLTGAIASRVCNKEHKPTFIFKLGKEKSRGSVRMPKGLNAVEAMKSCEHLLIMYGGHPPAAGFSLANENIDKFKECLEKYFKNI